MTLHNYIQSIFEAFVSNWLYYKTFYAVINNTFSKLVETNNKLLD